MRLKKCHITYSSRLSLISLTLNLSQNHNTQASASCQLSKAMKQLQPKPLIMVALQAKADILVKVLLMGEAQAMYLLAMARKVVT